MIRCQIRLQTVVLWCCTTIAVVQGCGGQSGSAEDSETHLLSCDEDSDCEELGNDFICHELQCRDQDELMLDGGSDVVTTPPDGMGGSSGIGADGSPPPAGAPNAGGTASVGPFTMIAEVVPSDVLILVDRSSTMFITSTGATANWEIARQALVEADGALVQLAGELNASLASYTTSADFSTNINPDGGPPITTGQCPVLESAQGGALTALDVDVFFFEHNLDEADAGFLQTPTAEGLRAGIDLLSQGASAAQKTVLLITDGHPDSCADADGQCVTDQAIAAAQYGVGLGVTTLVVVFDPLQGNLCTGRCEFDFVQDLANAGLGTPVAPNTAAYASCVSDWGRELEGSYATGGEQPGAAPYATLSDGHPLNASNIVDLLTGHLGCTLQPEVGADLDRGIASLQFGDLLLEEQGSWVLNEDGTLHLPGISCTELGADEQGELMVDVMRP